MSNENLINFEKLFAVVKTKEGLDPSYNMDDIVSLHTTHEDAMEEVADDESIISCYITFTDLTKLGIVEKDYYEDEEDTSEENEDEDVDGSDDPQDYKNKLLN